MLPSIERPSTINRVTKQESPFLKVTTSAVFEETSLSENSKMNISYKAPKNSTNMPSSHHVSATALIPSRPRRLWAVSDTKVPPYPMFYPKPSKYNSCYIVSQPDAPPSVIAIRIAECLLARSVVVDYDEEAVTATCLTVDRCLFVVHLWRIPSQKAPMPGAGNDVILVECVRTKGSCFAFQRAAKAILLAAQGLDSGKDIRKAFQSSPMEYPRFTQSIESNSFNADNEDSSTISPKLESKCDWGTMKMKGVDPSDVKTKVQLAMEIVLTLLRKDRLKPQLLGMEQLVALTDPESVNVDVALHSALIILGLGGSEVSDEEANYLSRRPIDDDEHVIGCINEIHQNWVLNLLIHRCLPSERNAGLNEGSNRNSTPAGAFNPARVELNEVRSPQLMSISDMDEDHAGKMRSLVMRTISNSFTCMSKFHAVQLECLLSVESPIWTSEAVVSALLDDIQKGASRPVQAVCSTRLSSPHDAAIACRILGLLCRHHSGVKQRLQNSKVFDSLELARAIGKSTHQVLAAEAHKMYQLLTEEDRSC